MKKIIKGKVSVLKKFSEDDLNRLTTMFVENENSPAPVSTSTNQPSGLFGMLTVKYPEINATMYTELSQSIEALRQDYYNITVQGLSLQNEQHNFVDDPWNRFFLSDTSKVKYVYITSTSTQKAFETGIDDEELDL